MVAGHLGNLGTPVYLLVVVVYKQDDEPVKVPLLRGMGCHVRDLQVRHVHVTNSHVEVKNHDAIVLIWKISRCV